MSNLDALSEKIRTEPALQERLAAVKALPPNEQLLALVALSEEFGCPVTAEEFQRPPSGELSEADLSSLSGGTQWEHNPFASTSRSEWFTPSPSQSQQAATQAKAAAHAFEKAMSPNAKAADLSRRPLRQPSNKFKNRSYRISPTLRPWRVQNAR